EIEEADVGGLRQTRDALEGRRDAGEADVAPLTHRAPLESAVRRAPRHRGYIELGAIVRELHAVERAPDVRVVERSDEALGDALALQPRERGVLRPRLDAVAVPQAAA